MNVTWAENMSVFPTVLSCGDFHIAGPRHICVKHLQNLAIDRSWGLFVATRIFIYYVIFKTETQTSLKYVGKISHYTEQKNPTYN